MEIKKAYTVIVYPGRTHWDRNSPIEELEESFQTEQEATDWADGIMNYWKDYICEIVHE